MTTHPMILVTIVCEAYALTPVKSLLRETGAHGWTHFPVEGDGAGGERTGETPEFSNVQIEVILPNVAAERLLERLASEFFSRYGMVVFASDVRVIRGGKF